MTQKPISDGRLAALKEAAVLLGRNGGKITLTGTELSALLASAKSAPVPADVAGLVERLREPKIPKVYALTELNDELFDCGLRHKTGKKPLDYLKGWLGILRNFAYATHDDSWGELEKEISITLWHHCQGILRQHEAADALLSLSRENAAQAAEIERLKAYDEIRADVIKNFHKELEGLRAENKAELTSLRASMTDEATVERAYAEYKLQHANRVGDDGAALSKLAIKLVVQASAGVK